MQLNAFDFKTVRQFLKNKLEFTNIYKEVSILTHMNRALEIELHHLQKIEILKDKNEQEIIAILTSISFLKYEEDNTVDPPRKIVRLAYNFPQNILIITGMLSETLNTLLNNFQRKHDCIKGQIRKIAHNQYYTLIDTFTKQNAELLKGYFRNHKKRLEDKAPHQFKFQNRKVRIILMHQEDLFTFLTDIMAEYKAQKFIKSMNQGRKRIVSKITYRPFLNMTLRVQIQQNQRYKKASKPKQQKQQKSKSKQEVKSGRIIQEDESSESTSLNSQMLEVKDFPEQNIDKDESCGFLSDNILTMGVRDE